MAFLIDLDNTLVDPDRAFATSAASFIPSIGGSTEDVTWFLSEDKSGYTPRASLTDGLLSRLHPGVSANELLEALMVEHLAYKECNPGVPEGLEEFRSRAEKVVIVTNGTVAQQARKISLTGPGCTG